MPVTRFDKFHQQSTDDDGIVNNFIYEYRASDKSVKVWNFNFTGEGKFQSETIVKEFSGHKSGVAEAIVVDSLNSV